MQTADHVPSLSTVGKQLVEKYWLGLLEPALSQLLLCDTRTAWNNSHLNGDVFHTFYLLCQEGLKAF